MTEGSKWDLSQRHVHNDTEHQAFNWPKACWGGTYLMELDRASPEERSKMMAAWGGTTTADRDDWLNIIATGKKEGWFKVFYGNVEGMSERGSRVVTRLQGKASYQESLELVADYIVDCTGLISKIDETPLIADLIKTYDVGRNRVTGKGPDGRKCKRRLTGGIVLCFLRRSRAAMAGTGKEWKAHDRVESTERGGDKGLPRSFGLTLEAVRYKLNLNRPDMMAELASIPFADSPWPFTDYNKDAKNPGGLVGAWEIAKTNPRFGTLHRYGMKSETLAGVLLIASHFYARLRDASDPKEDAQRHLDEITEIVGKLRGLCDFAELEVRDMQESLPSQQCGRAQFLSLSVGNGHVRKKHLEFINELLDAYRKS